MRLADMAGGDIVKTHLLRSRTWVAVLLFASGAAFVRCAQLADKLAHSPQLASPRSTLISLTGTDRYQTVRNYMVHQHIELRGVRDPEVLRAMRSVPRHEFVPQDYLEKAYADQPLPIGYGQTISQPYIVAAMTELLQLKQGDRILEIGTGSGYQAAILAELTDEVYSVEIIEELYERATELLLRLGYTQIKTKHGDGYYGWEEHAPYDAIVVTAAPDHIPQPLINQLSDGGRMVIPVGPQGTFQTLWLIEKDGEKVTSTSMMGVVFVPLTGSGSAESY